VTYIDASKHYRFNFQTVSTFYNRAIKYLSDTFSMECQTVIVVNLHNHRLYHQQYTHLDLPIYKDIHFDHI
jgi:hypothetical protein